MERRNDKLRDDLKGMLILYFDDGVRWVRYGKPARTWEAAAMTDEEQKKEVFRRPDTDDEEA